MAPSHILIYKRFLTILTWLYLFLGLSFMPNSSIAISIAYQVGGKS